MRIRWTLYAGIAALTLVSLGLPATAHGAIDGVDTGQTDGPTRAALDLHLSPLATLAPATTAAPEEIEEIARWNLSGAVPAKIGFSRDLATPREIHLSAADLSRPSPFPLAGGVVTQTASSLVWSGAVQIAQAHALRLHLTAVDLPAGSRVWTYTRGETAVALPASLLERSTGHPEHGLWTGTAFGGTIWLEVSIPRAALRPAREVGFTIDRIGELVALDPTGRPLTGDDAPADRALVERDESCFVDATCAEKDYPEAVDRARDAVALIDYESDDGGFFLCTGTLVADADPRRVEQRAFFLTANHCVSSQTEAESMDASFEYRTKSCGGSPRQSELIVGADLLKTIELTDTTLLELSGLPSSPQFVPFNPDRTPYGELVDVLGHPQGRPLSFSRHEVASGVPCDDDPWLATLDRVGCVGPGSSGSAALDEDGRLVGILRGACGNETTITTFFGRFSISYPELASILATRPAADFFTDPKYPDYQFLVEIDNGTTILTGTRESACLPETVCVSGALPGRSEVFIRIVGPRSNGFYWPTLVKFTTSKVTVTIRRVSTGEEQMYVLDGASPGVDELPGLFDRHGFAANP